jgi:cytosine/adenosine deaminase-related metal-dependent hydrolase
VAIGGCAIATVDAAGTEYSSGHVVVTAGRITAVGAGPAPTIDGARRVDGRGCLATPGFVNTHHHLYQWLTRGYVPDGTLFEWLTALYPVWAHIDADLEYVAASAGLAALALSGCTTAMDHHYVFPASGGDLLAAEIEAARRIGVRLHTHLAETDDEEEFCLAHFGARPVDYVESLGWLGDDVWLAHCVHLSDGDIAKYGATGTGVAHCPSSNARLGAGTAPIPELLAAGAPVGLGVDGVASNEHGGLAEELHQALLFARARLGPQALTARQALWMATFGGARCLGRSDAIGSLEVGKLGDLALWRLDGLGHSDIADPVCALVFGPPAPLELLLVGGRAVVDGGELRTADVTELAAANRTGARELADRAGLR